MEESSIATRPKCEWADLASVVEQFGSWTLVKELPSERDRNFRIRNDAGEEAVLKIHNSAEDPGFVECQNLALQRCSNAGAPCQRSLLAKNGEAVLKLESPQGPLLCRALSFLQGDMLDAQRWRDNADRRVSLWGAVGRAVGAVAAALDGFDHPAAPNEFVWDLRRFENVVAAHATKVVEARRPILNKLVESFRATLGPLLPSLRVSVVHGDANDFNLVVLEGGEVGVLDFGDMCRSYTVADAAICAAYLLFACPPDEPLAESLLPFLTAFHERCPLQESEVRSFFGLAVMRLCTSVCMSAYQCSLEPDNEYLAISAGPAWELLERVAGESDPFGAASQAVLLRACGLVSQGA
eukprot:TRINITY_DN24989_c0_g1_i1.p1 TRINITY_DN24989_c0_g1~~TRINITY_DN24989_c0_g1_i1.p1  ORF type:complete len:353 (+),score=53.04 TRINITY_DN24989_c0_g1_i1:62-1120(+)